MGKSGRSGGSRYTSAKRADSRPVVVNSSNAPSVNTGGGGILGNLASSAVMGVGLGAGSEVGHRVVGKMLDGEKKEVCDRRMLDDCLRTGGECVEEMREFMRCLEKGAK